MSNQNGLPSASSSDRPSDRIESLKSSIKEAGEHLSTAAAAIKDRASETKSHVAARARSLAARASQAIKDHPIAAIGIALGAGYLIVRLARR